MQIGNPSPFPADALWRLCQRVSSDKLLTPAFLAPSLFYRSIAPSGPSRGRWNAAWPRFGRMDYTDSRVRLLARGAGGAYLLCTVPDKAARDCTAQPFPSALSRMPNLRGMQMGITAWALIVLLSVAFIAVVMMAALSLTRSDGGE